MSNKCRVTYIDRQFKEYPELKERLTDVYHDIWKQITNSKLFREYGSGPNATYLFSAPGTEQNKKQIALIKKINESVNAPEGTSVIQSKPTKAGNNSKVVISVHPIAQQEYDNLNIPVQGTLFQKKGTEVTKASPEAIKVVKDFLNRIGVKIESGKEIIVDGKRLDVNGVANVTAQLIQLIDGKEDVALTEEAMHFAVEIIEQTNPALFNQMLKEINGYNMYDTVIKDYSSDPHYQTKDGKPDIRKLKKEAIGKVLAQTIIRKIENVAETPENSTKAQSWWKNILNWIKTKFLSSGFDQAAMDIISGKNIGTTADIIAADGTVFLQKTEQESNKNKLLDIDKRLTKKDVTIDGKQKEVYMFDGDKQVKNRVSDFVSDWYARRFDSNEIEKNDYEKALDDLRMEKGSKLHFHMEYLVKGNNDGKGGILVDVDGYRRITPIDDSLYANSLSENERQIYNILKENMKLRLESYEKDNKPGERTIFLSEVQIYDAKANKAGTLDFVAIKPNGKISILDWKFMDLNTQKYEDVPWYKVGAWKYQMDQYKNMLKNAYGIDEKMFEDTMMIPIKTEYSRGNSKEGILPTLLNIEIGDVNVKAINKDYLVPVGIESQKTGNRNVDKLIQKLNLDYKELSEKKIPESEKRGKAEQLNALYKGIRQLQMRKDIAPLLYQAQVLNRSIENLMKRYEDNWVGRDPKSFSDEEINAFSRDILSAEKSLKTYTSLDIALDSLFNNDMSEADKELKKKLEDTVKSARFLEESLNHTKIEFSKDFNSMREDVEDGDKPDRVIKGFSRIFNSTATLQSAGMSALFRKTNRALTKAAMDTYDEAVKLKKLKSEYVALAKSKGLGIKNMFDLIKKKDKNELIDEFDIEFYRTLKKKVNDAEDTERFDWIRNNIDVVAFNKELDDIRAKEIQRTKDKTNNNERIGTEKEVAAEEAKEIDKINNKYNTSSPEGAGWLQYKIVKKFPKEKWQTKEWKELNAPANVAAKNFYNYIKERNEYYQSVGYVNAKQARTFLPWVRKGLVEKMVFGGNISFGEQFLRAISVDEGDIGLGKIDVRTGQLVNSIPKYFTSQIEGEVSTDLFKTMALYNEMAIKFKYLSDIEEQALLLSDIERNKKAIATTLFGKTRMNEDNEPILVDDNSKNSELMDKMIKATIYGQKFIDSESFDVVLGKIGGFGEKINKMLGIKILPENLQGRKLSGNKMIHAMNNYFQMKTLGLSLLSPTSNLFGGTAQSIINSGKYFTKEDYAATEMWINAKMVGMIGMENKQKAIAAMNYFLPLTENFNAEAARKLSLSKLSDEGIQNFLMYLMRSSENHVQAVNFYSFLKNSIVENGEVVNVREYLKKTPEYRDFYAGTAEERAAREKRFEEDIKKLVEEKGVMKVSKLVDGELVIPDVERKSDSVIALRRKIQQISKDALGARTEDDKRLANMTIYGDSMMLFKNWIPRLMDVRFGALKYNSASDAYEWGRMRTLFSTLGWDLMGTANKLKNTFIANDKGIEAIREIFEQKRIEYKRETGKDLMMTDSEFIDLFKRNMRGQMKDLLFLLTLVSLYMGMKALPPDDDEDPAVKNQWKFMLRAVDKLRDEISFFYDPSSFANLLSTSIFPSIKVITDFQNLFTNFLQEMFGLALGNEDWVDDAKPMKYLMKTFPVSNQVAQYLPMFYPDLAKDLGLRMQATSGFGR